MCSHRLVRVGRLYHHGLQLGDYRGGPTASSLGGPTASNIAQELLGHADLIKQISKDYQTQRDYPNMGHAGRRRDFRASSKDMEAAKHIADAFRAQLHRS